MQMGTHPGHLALVRAADGGDANNDPLSQTLPVLSFNCHLFLIGIVTTGEVYLHSPSASNGGDSAGSFQSIAKHIVIVDLHNNATIMHNNVVGTIIPVVWKRAVRTEMQKG